MQLVTRLLLRLVLVGSVMMMIALALTLLAARHDIADEVDSSQRIGRLVSTLSSLHASTSLEQRVAAIDALNASGSLRNFRVVLRDVSGRSLTRDLQQEAPPGVLASWLLRGREASPYALPLAFADGTQQILVLEPQPQAESAEAVTAALLQFGLFGAITLALIAVLWVSVRHALAPLSGILAGIARIELGDYGARIGECATRELNLVAQALNHLAEALTEQLAKQRELLNRLQDVQEEERRSLAHELHDEFGQLLTALQVDASYLLKQTGGQPALQECAKAMYENSGSILAQLRGLLAQLRPYGLQGGEENQIALEQALRDLVRQRQSRADAALDCRLSVSLQDTAIPQRLAVAIYRIAQEALTNVLRHAGASEVRIALALDAGARALTLTIADNGRGLRTDAGRKEGIGLAGIRERVLANNGSLALQNAPGGGLALLVTFPLPSALAQPAAVTI
jgi:two-component system sensor histidine kinase UhpB